MRAIEDMLRPLSPEELAQVPELTFEQIAAALELGRQARADSERLSHSPSLPGIYFR